MMHYFKTILSGSTYVFLLFLLSCFGFADVIYGYSFKDCIVKGSLQSYTMKLLCTKRQLHFVPENIPSKVRVLDMSYNKITVIKKNNLLNLSNLQHLNVTKNQIRHVEDGAFRDLLALQELNLSYNNISTVTEELFQNLFNLTVLRLDENMITNINTKSFLPLGSLMMLNLSGNYLHQISKLQPVFQIPSIQKLHIGKNGFTSFQTRQLSNTSLQIKILDLSRNPLQLFEITEDIFPQLELLDLSYVNQSIKWIVQDKRFLRNVFRLNVTGIQMMADDLEIMLQTFNSTLINLRLQEIGEKRVKQITKSACLIKTLQTLRLESNNLSSITEDELLHCTNLTVLDLCSNRFTKIRLYAFQSLKKRSSLSLFRNKLITVPTAIQNLTTLEILDLSFNAIKVITCSDFRNLVKLKILHIYSNSLFLVEHSAFQNLDNLNMLLIGTNRLMNLTGCFTKGLKKLERFDAAQNSLSLLQAGEFSGLQSLRLLQLVDNQIEVIEPGAFAGLQNLNMLDLQSNKITQTSIQNSVFSELKNLKSLHLNKNFIYYSNQKRLEQPPFKFLNSLKVLCIYSQGNDGMRNIPSNVLEGLTSLKILWAGNVNINSLHPDTFTYTPNLWLLDLSKNHFTSLSGEIFQPLKILHSFTMVQSGLQSLDFFAQANLREVHYLLIRRNSVAVINATLTDSLPNLSYVDLQENDFSCECENAWFINWTIKNNDTQVINADGFRCSYPLSFRGNRLLDLDMASCVVDVGLIFFASTASFVLVMMLSSFLYHFLRWQVVYAYYLFLAYLYDRKQLNSQQKHFQFDAFISYNTHDELWVINELLPQLEGQQGWRLCLHHRDFQPGKPIIDNIVDGIYKSRKTICVISRHYLESEWCSREIQVASFRLFDEKKDVLVLVFLEDIPAHQLSPHYRMRSLIKKRTYLSWPKPGQDTQVFWQKLRAALENPACPKQ